MTHKIIKYLKPGLVKVATNPFQYFSELWTGALNKVKLGPTTKEHHEITTANAPYRAHLLQG